MRGKNYTPSEIEYITTVIEANKNHYDHNSIECIALALDRSESSVLTMIYKLKSKGRIKATGNRYRPYTESELTFIEENYGHLTIREIAMELGRSKKAIQNTIARLKEKEEMQDEGA